MLSDKLRRQQPEAKEKEKLQRQQPEAKEKEKLRQRQPANKRRRKLAAQQPEAKRRAKELREAQTIERNIRMGLDANKRISQPVNIDPKLLKCDVSGADRPTSQGTPLSSGRRWGPHTCDPAKEHVRTVPSTT